MIEVTGHRGANSLILRPLWNSIFLSVTATVFSLSMTSILAYPLADPGLPGRRFFNFLVVLTIMINLGFLPKYLLIRDLKLMNTYWSIILVGGINSFNLILMRNYFQSIPRELFDSARIDGASERMILIRIVMPLALPVMATIFLFYFVDYWNEYFRIILYITDRTKHTLQVILRSIIILDEDMGADEADVVGQKRALWVRTDILDKLGLDMPWTLEEFVDSMKKMRENVPTPDGGRMFPYISKTYHPGYISGLSNYFDVSPLPVMRRPGEKKFREGWDSPQFRDYAEFVKMLWDEQLIDPDHALPQKASKTRSKFYAGKGAYLFMWDWRYQEMISRLRENFPDAEIANAHLRQLRIDLLPHSTGSDQKGGRNPANSSESRTRRPGDKLLCARSHGQAGSRLPV